MSHKRRNTILIILIVLFIVIFVFVYPWYQFMLLEIGHRPTKSELTATSIVAQNQTIEALIHQLETATAQVAQGTFTPSPTSSSGS